MRRFLTTVALTLMLPPALFGQTQAQFYVAADGSDSNPGTLDRPFASLARARDAVRVEKSSGMTGDIVVNCGAGDYPVANTVKFNEQDSGVGGHFVVYKNQDAVGSARFIGGHALTGWQVHSGNIYKVNVGGQQFHTLFENGRRCRKARTPNLDPGPGYPMSKADYLTTEGANGSHTTLEYKAGDLNPTGWDISNAQVFIWSGGKWDWFTDVVPISSINPGARRITLSQNTRYGIYQNSSGSRYFVQGVLDLLDEAGEYHLDTNSGWLYYWPLSAPISNQLIVAPDVERIVEIQGASETLRASSIRFEGLAFEVSDFTDWYRFAHVNAGDSGESHSYPQYDRAKELPQHRTGMFFLTNAENIEIRYCHFKNSGHSAVFMEGYNQGHLVYGNWIEHVGYSGVYLDGKYPGEGDVSRNNVISNNKIHDVGEELGHAAGVGLSNTGQNEVSYSEVFNTPRYAVKTTAYVNLPTGAVYAHGNVTKYVRVYAAAQDSGDTAPIYSWGLSDALPYLANQYEQVSVDRSYAHPSVTDISPNGVFMDNDTYGQSFQSVEVTNSHGASFRNNDSGAHLQINVSWVGGFNYTLMDYAAIGLKADFPREYGGANSARSILHHGPFLLAGAAFDEGFENGLLQWSNGKGAPLASSNVVHGGAFSYEADEDEDVIYKEFGFSQNRMVEAWYYDNGASAKIAMMRVDQSVWDDSNGWVGLGVHTGITGSNYVVRLGSSTSATAVPRSVGWHLLEWDYTSGSLVLLKIDGVVVGSTTSTTAFDRIALGDWWGGSGAGGNYFDDIRIY